MKNQKVNFNDIAILSSVIHMCYKVTISRYLVTIGYEVS